MVRKRVLTEYIIHTQQQYNKEFFEWRQKMLELQSQGFKDDRFGYRQPLLVQKRVVYSFQQVNYDPNLTWQMNKASLLS